MTNLTVQVLSNEREPLGGIRVRFDYIERILDGDRFTDTLEGVSEEVATDRNGCAHFNDFDEKHRLIKIYLNNKFVGRDYATAGRDIRIIRGTRVKYDDGKVGEVIEH